MVGADPQDPEGGEMFSRARRLTRKRRFLTGLVLGFATFVVAGSASAAATRPYEPQYAQTVNSGVVSTSLVEQHMLREARDAELAAGVRTPDYSHLPAEDRAALTTPESVVPQTHVTGAPSSGTGFDGSDWLRGIALAVALIAASSFAVLMVRGGARTAHS
jgi:hypothetical protein